MQVRHKHGRLRLTGSMHHDFDFSVFDVELLVIDVGGLSVVSYGGFRAFVSFLMAKRRVAIVENTTLRLLELRRMFPSSANQMIVASLAEASWRSSDIAEYLWPEDIAQLRRFRRQSHESESKTTNKEILP